jgi:hypothetical protein
MNDIVINNIIELKIFLFLKIRLIKIPKYKRK